MNKKITLKNILENKDKYLKIDKKIKKMVKRNHRDDTIAVISHFGFSFILCSIIILSLEISAFTILGGFLLALFTGIFHSVYLNKILYPNSYSNNTFGYDTKETEKFVKKNKNILKYYNRKDKKEFYYQLIINKLKDSTKAEIKESSALIEKYCKSLSSKEIEKKIEIKTILNKKINSKKETLKVTQVEISNTLNILNRI